MHQTPDNSLEENSHSNTSPFQQKVLRTINFVTYEEMHSNRSGSCSDFIGFPPLTREEIASTRQRINLASQRSQSAGAACVGDAEMEFFKSASSVKSVHGSVSYNELTPKKRQRTNASQLPQKCTLATQRTPPDHVYEINSNSTTQTQKQKRLLRNKLQLNLGTTQNNKCSTESSEFPVSSPSNPVGNKSKQRPALLKHTLPGDTFERQLALITAQKPQMSLDEKMRSWKCDADISDVEDVNNFDELFQVFEDDRRKIFRGIKEKVGTSQSKSAVNESENSIKYDFNQFRKMMMQNLKVQFQKNPAQQPDKPTTSAAAHLAAQRMRLKAAAAAIAVEKNDCRGAKDKKKARNSTTPPATSSSENDVACYPKAPHQKSVQKVHYDDKVLCASSSEEEEEDRIKIQPTADADSTILCTKKQAHDTEQSLQNCSGTATHKDSVFRSKRLNPEIDKTKPIEAKGLIQMRLDFLESKKNLNLKGKISELFKTPTVPLKHDTPQKKINNENNDKKSSPAKEQHLETSKPPDAPMSVGAAFHQQHEFCNYLGLTGMSTAFAVANAVAELSKESLTRRSLRVRHQKHQEKKQKDKKNETKGHNEPTKAKLVQAAHNHNVYVNPTLPARRKTMLEKTKEPLSLSMEKSPTRLQNIEEPKIKILSHLCSSGKTEIGQISNKSTHQIIDQLKKPVVNTFSNDTSNCARSSERSKSDVCEKPCTNQTSKLILQNRHTGGDDYKSSTPNSTLDKREPEASKNGRSTSLSQDSPIKCNSNQDELENGTLLEEIVESQSPTIPVEAMHQKIQKYLEVSRQVKPSIYIVQSMYNDNEHIANDLKSSEAKNAAKEKQSSIITEVKNTAENSPVSIKQKKIQKSPKSFKCKIVRIRKSKRNLLTSAGLNIGQNRQLRIRPAQITSQGKNRNVGNIVKKITSKEQIKLKNQTNNKLEISKQKTNIEIRNKQNQVRPMITYQNKQNNMQVTRTPISRKTPDKAVKIVLKRNSSSANDLNTSHMQLSKSRHLDTSALPQPAVSPLRRQSTNADHTKLQIEKIDNKVESSQIETSLAAKPDTITDTMVSSTTNTDGETYLATTIIEKKMNHEVGVMTSQTIIKTKESGTQTRHLHFLIPPANTTALQSPIKHEHGRVLYIYYEMDVLIVVQQSMVSFWKYSKLLIVLATAPQLRKQKQYQFEQSIPGPSTSSNIPNPASAGEWLHLGECKRLVNDIEIASHYPNRIGIHNSIPVYMEMRCVEVPRKQRECNLLSMYINVYYYQDEELLAKMHSIHLDAVQSIPCNIVYTTITDSRYFIMSWPQENVLNKVRSGLCKYSLTPQLDTLASIREFKSMRHEIRHLQCSEDDKLLGFGSTQFTIWDHRSGDVLMSYDLHIPLGRNLGSIYYPCLDIGQNNTILLFQYISGDHHKVPELIVIACMISHSFPSYRVLQRVLLPTPGFHRIKNAINTGEHLVLTSQNDEEIWISCNNPNFITCAPVQRSQRFFARGRTQVIELSEKSLTVDSFANYVLKLSMGVL